MPTENFESHCYYFVETLKVAQNSFQHLNLDGSVITTLCHLMLQSWYQKTAQSLVNTLSSFSLLVSRSLAFK